MKLKIRYVILFGLTAPIAVIIVLTTFLDVQLKKRTVGIPGDDGFDSGTREFEGGAHMPILRKRLTKSNYTSDDVGNLSPEKMDRVATNQTREKVGVNFKSRSDFDSIINFTDPVVDNLLEKLKSLDRSKFSNYQLSKLKSEKSHKQRKLRKGGKLPVYKNYKSSQLTNWERFHIGIHQYGLYSDDDPSIDGLLLDMAVEPIVDVEMKEGGTQLKLIITFTDEGQALFKPMSILSTFLETDTITIPFVGYFSRFFIPSRMEMGRLQVGYTFVANAVNDELAHLLIIYFGFARNVETLPNHFYFSDYERHYAEIAAFHLDRALGFYRVPPTAGRLVNLTYDIKRLAESKLVRTFFISPAGNVCFHGDCSYYCDTSHALCGNPDMLEGSFASFLPPEKIAPRKTWRNPWKRSYSKRRKAYWEVYDDLCDKVRVKPPYDTGRRLLDLMDLHIFDFITGNLDRHHYETFQDFGNETFLLHLDNGRAFGKTKQDDLSILAPLYQCCLIRHSTFIKLVRFYLGPTHLSDVMREYLKKDKVHPILVEAHFPAMDRRVMKILKIIADCIYNGNNYADVIVDDFY